MIAIILSLVYYMIIITILIILIIITLPLHCHYVVITWSSPSSPCHIIITVSMNSHYLPYHYKYILTTLSLHSRNIVTTMSSHYHCHYMTTKFDTLSLRNIYTLSLSNNGGCSILVVNHSTWFITSVTTTSVMAHKCSQYVIIVMDQTHSIFSRK